MIEKRTQTWGETFYFFMYNFFWPFKSLVGRVYSKLVLMSKVFADVFFCSLQSLSISCVYISYACRDNVFIGKLLVPSVSYIETRKTHRSHNHRQNDGNITLAHLFVWFFSLSISFGRCVCFVIFCSISGYFACLTQDSQHLYHQKFVTSSLNTHIILLSFTIFSDFFPTCYLVFVYFAVFLCLFLQFICFTIFF